MMTPTAFRKLVLAHYTTHGRHALPWRATRDPYHILVSEVMLQQTQVERVIPYYEAWLKEFPTAQALAKAPLSRVLRAWQGLGYNRRARMLHEAGKEIAKRGMPKTAAELEALPGVGPYTARAVAAFAYNEDGIFIETNIRTVITHHFFPGSEKVSDNDILPILKRTYPKGKAREWYAALMDYGSHLKRSGVRINTRSKHYAKQTKFQGSTREARGAILKALVLGPREPDLLINLFGSKRRTQMRTQLASMTKEGMIELRAGKFRLPK